MGDIVLDDNAFSRLCAINSRQFSPGRICGHIYPPCIRDWSLFSSRERVSSRHNNQTRGSPRGEDVRGEIALRIYSLVCEENVLSPVLRDLTKTRTHAAIETRTGAIMRPPSFRPRTLYVYVSSISIRHNCMSENGSGTGSQPGR